jgi:C-terminal processing protease CtpA/Prc
MIFRIKTVTPAALIAALALSAFPQHSPAADAASASAAAQADARRQAEVQASESKKQAEIANTEKRLVEAQRQLDAAARRVAELSSELGTRRGDQFFTFRNGEGPMGRAMIGVQLARDEGQGGAKVMDVSPGGPAADAGVKSGDIITSIGGQDLTKESDPSATLVEKMRDVDPNLKIQLGLLREGKKLNVDVMPRAQQVFRFERRTGPGGPGGPIGRGGPGLREFNVPVPPPMAGGTPRGRGGEVREFVLNRMEEGGMGLRFHGIEFATLSERLGGYFGVKSGVLVVRAGNNPAFKLQDGDVILAIDGREPNSAQHAGRILRSYQPGEKLTIKVQRDRKAQNLEVTAPGGGED